MRIIDVIREFDKSIGSGSIAFVLVIITYYIPSISLYSFYAISSVVAATIALAVFKTRQLREINFRQPYIVDVCSIEERLEKGSGNRLNAHTTYTLVVRNRSPEYPLKASPIIEEAIDSDQPINFLAHTVSAEVMGNLGITGYRTIGFEIRDYGVMHDQKENWFVHPYRYIFDEPLYPSDIAGCGVTYEVKDVYGKKDEFIYGTHIPIQKLIIRLIAPKQSRFKKPSYTIKDQANKVVDGELKRLKKKIPRLAENSAMIQWEIRDPIVGLDYELAFEIE